MIFKGDPANQRIYIQINQIKEMTKRGIRQAFYKIGKDLLETSNELILSPDKTGRIYMVRTGSLKRLKRHQSSAPGEPPANLTGNLRKSIGFSVRGSEQLEFGSRSEAPQGGKAPQAVASYSKDLELGNSKVSARPYLKPSINKNEKNMYTWFSEEIEKQLKQT